MSYVDGFVIPVPTRNLTAYRRMARKAGKVWREHGALEYIECGADDVKPGKQQHSRKASNTNAAKRSSSPGSGTSRVGIAIGSMPRSCRTRALPR